MRRRRKEAFTARLTLCLAVYAACCLIITGFVFSLYRTSSGGAASLTVEDSDGKVLCRLSPDEFNVNGAEYISASALSKLYSFTLAGDREKVNMYFFSFPQETQEEAQSSQATDDDSAEEVPLKKPETAAVHAESETVRLFKDSSLLEINGENARLGAKVIFTDDYYIPLELIENYFNGAIIERDGGKVTLSRNEDARFTLRLHDPRS